MEKKNGGLIALVVVLALLVGLLGGYFIMNNFSKSDNSSNASENVDNQSNTVELKNYNLSEIESIEISYPEPQPDSDPVSRRVLLQKDSEKMEFLLYIDQAEFVGPVTSGIGFEMPTEVTIHYYNATMPNKSIILSNKGHFITFTKGDSSSYMNYATSNENLREDIINKYFK